VPAQDRDYAGYLASETSFQAGDASFQAYDTSGGQGWTLPAGDSWDDGGWRIAETMPQPSAGGQTTAGLPTRVPGANMFRRQDGGWAPSRRPAGGLETELLTPPRRAPRQRSPEHARRSLSGFQLGSRDAEASTLSAETLSAEEGASP
jgi:hypothetical protein